MFENNESDSISEKTSQVNVDDYNEYPASSIDSYSFFLVGVALFLIVILKNRYKSVFLS